MRWRSVRRLLLGVFALGLAYFAVSFVQVWHATSWSDEEPVDAIVVMGAAQYNGVPSPVLAGRLDRAVELFDGEVAPVIVVTGGRQQGDTTTEAKASYDYLRARGVPDDRIQLEVDGTNSWESLAAAARFLRRDGRDDVVVVSDPYHSLRVAGIASDVGLKGNVAPTDRKSSWRSISREALAVSVGRLIGYRRL